MADDWVITLLHILGYGSMLFLVWGALGDVVRKIRE